MVARGGGRFSILTQMSLLFLFSSNLMSKNEGVVEVSTAKRIHSEPVRCGNNRDGLSRYI